MNRPGLFAAFSSEWQPPSPAEFRELLKVADLTGSQAGLLVGVPGGRIRKWAGGDGAIPYAVWRLLTIYVGLAAALRINNEITK
ncbi:transcriptional regulator [Pseudomonas sp. NMI795_08]|nr:transcriptional regulator [Pseudomonas sp. NMI795_08]